MHSWRILIVIGLWAHMTVSEKDTSLPFLEPQDKEPPEPHSRTTTNEPPENTTIFETKSRQAAIEESTHEKNKCNWDQLYSG